MSTKPRAPKIVCFDTQILSYLVLKDPLANEFFERASQLLIGLMEQKVSIIVPSLVLSELLVAYAPNEQNGIRAVIEQDFRIVTFDNLAAWQSARIYRLNKESGRHKEVVNADPNYPYPRQKLKVDHMIVGTAKANKADMLYTNDTGVFSFAQGNFNALMLPEMGHRQLPLPEYE